MNIREYFVARFPEYDLNYSGGTSDGCTIGDILAEVEVSTPCGIDCKTVIDVAVLMVDRVYIAFGEIGRPYHVTNILDATVDVICTLIRG